MILGRSAGLVPRSAIRTMTISVIAVIAATIVTEMIRATNAHGLSPNKIHPLTPLIE
jgi:hypothetical protein